MMIAPSAADVDAFRSLAGKLLGLRLGETGPGDLARILMRRIQVTGLGSGAYLETLRTGSTPEEIGSLAQELTVGETYFFRNMEQFDALKQTCLPGLLHAEGRPAGLRILSAGSASGEEAYSLAMSVHDVPEALAAGCRILGVDVNPSALERARRARYSTWALRETSPEARKRWFRSDGSDFVLQDGIRESVDFEPRNLSQPNEALWRPGAWDVVFCRNVMMYMTTASALLLARRIATSLAPGGYLFLGHAETLRGLSHDFHLRHTHGTFYYQLKEKAGQYHPAAEATEPMAAITARESTDGPGVWVEAIQRASGRIASLARGAPAPDRPIAPRTPGWSLGPALELLQQERYSEALGLVGALPAGSTSDPDAMLLHAVLLAQHGSLGEAEAACLRLLSLDELNAGAHYVLALCREGSGDAAGAAVHDEMAAYLDSGFAMPRLHLGLLAHRAGDMAAARKQLTQALALFQREEAARLLLFGGGFHRDALLALCRAKLRACGGEP